MSTPPPITDISEAIRVLASAESPISPGAFRDDLTTLLDGITAGHRLIPETNESVALCACGDEWVCADVEHAAQLARTITRAHDDERARVGNNWRV